jgi:TRAP-type C4-dicarboxylate transport system permease small subunit
LVNKAIAIFGIAVCIGMVIMTVVDIILRRFFNAPLAFSFELTQLALVVMVFAFIPYTTSHNRHVSIEVLVQTFPNRFKQWITTTGDILSAILFAFICRQSFLKGLQVKEYEYMTGELEIMLYPFYYFVALGALLSCISLSLLSIAFIVSKIKREK